MAHPMRLKLLLAISEGEVSVLNIAMRLGIPPGAVSKHLTLLRDNGVVAARKDGNRVDQLAAQGKNVVTMCPFCWVNLSKAAGDKLVINDIASALAGGRRRAASSC